MVLRCPHCGTRSHYTRGEFSGKWVTCHECEAPFAWQPNQATPERTRPAWGQAARGGAEERKS
jgi:endogenous inhibitor of DNA gyrase (YacG/DUF329 family)